MGSRWLPICWLALLTLLAMPANAPAKLLGSGLVVPQAAAAARALGVTDALECQTAYQMMYQVPGGCIWGYFLKYDGYSARWCCC
jgi:hypothetical protein